MKITLVIFGMSSGGAERVMAIMANYWAKRDKDITLITLRSVDSDFYVLDSRINRIALNLYSNDPVFSFRNFFSRLRLLRKAIKDSHPDVVISFMARMNATVLLSTIGVSVPVIVSEHNDHRQSQLGFMWTLLRRWSYSWADAVVVLTDELCDVASKFVSKNRLHVIPNPAVPVPENENLEPPFDLPSPFIVSMGRLNPQKGFDLLLEAFSRIDSEEWSLVILGEGEERETLESLVVQYGLSSRVFLPGRVNIPSTILRQADLFVLSSRYEGFPMAILEALSCGLPVLSFDCPTGPNVIIRDGIDGVLVPAEDVEALAKGIKRLIGDEQERFRLAKKANEVVGRFSTEKVMAKWECLLDGVI
ncbi:MAG: glycosyltransferase family 4 protein [Gammaproteobacteria bacterium]|nr:glycosyltransferase family 4 protein [Gammaproteobacteria bacterium]